MSEKDWVDDPTFKSDESDWVDVQDSAPSKINPLVSAGRNFLQGITANYSDEVAGLVEGAGAAAGLEGLGAGPMKDVSLSDDGPTLDWEVLKHAYKRARDKERESLKKDKKDNPGTSMAANLAGAIASPVNKILPNASLAKSGMAIGGITGLGASEAEDLGGMAIDTGIGLGVGGVLGKGVDAASPIISSGVQKVSEGAKKIAERLAARAVGAERGTIKKLGQEKVQDAGRYALDEGLLSPLASTDDVIARNEATKTAAANSRKAAYDQIDNAGASAFNPLDVASNVEKEIIGGKNRAHDDVKELIEALDPHLSNILSRGEGNIPMSKAQELVEAIGKKAKFDTSRSTTQNSVAKEVYSQVRQAINDAAAKGAESVGVAGLKKTIEAANKTYTSGKAAEALLKNKLAREQGNNLLGLTDTITGAGALGYGGFTGDWETAGSIMLAKKGLQKYGVQNAALGANKIAQALSKSPQMAQVLKNNPKAFGAIVSQIESRMPTSNVLPRAADQKDDAANFNDDNSKDAILAKTQGSRYGQVMQNAAKNGDQSLAAAHYVLSTRDGNYRKITGGK